MGADVPAPLPTSERRDAVIAALTEAFTAGRIGLEDFEARTELAVRARTTGELESALAGVAPALPAVRADTVPVTPSRKGSRLTVACMSGTSRKGRWLPARRHFAAALMGGAKLDFRDAVLGPGVTDVYIFAMWGGVDVAVPPGMDVDVGGLAVMGSLERASETGSSRDPDRPRLRIHALALMGGVEVKVRPVQRKGNSVPSAPPSRGS